VRDANEAGGRDNITVVAFRLADAEDLAADDGATLVGPSAEEAGLTGTAVREGVARQRERAVASTGSQVAGRRSRWRTAAKVLIAALVVAAVCVGAVIGARQVYFLGTDEGGRLTLYRGLPYDLPLGIELYSEEYNVPVQVASLPEERRESAINHELRSREDAVDLLEDLEGAAATATEPPTTEPNPGGGQGGAQGGGQNAGGADGPGDGGQQAGGGSGNQRQSPPGN
jgi:protein phosphatase